MSLCTCMYKSVYINTWTYLLLSIYICTHTCIYLCPTILRNRAAVTITICYNEFTLFCISGSIRSGMSVAEEQWFWKVWLGKTALVGKIMSSLIHYSFTRQLTLDKSVILILYSGCDLANKYFMWKKILLSQVARK